MRRIDVLSLLELHGLDFDEAAQALFPTNKFPSKALYRVVRGQALLDSDQVYKLSTITGMPINDLFLGGWSSEVNKNTARFIFAGYKCILDRRTFSMRVYHGEKQIYDEVLVNGYVSISVFLNTLDKIVEDYESDEF